MYLHLGGGSVVADERIIGIFDLDNTTADSRDTRAFLAGAEKAGIVVMTGDDLPKSFVVCTDDDKIYLSQLSSATLYKRSELNLPEM